MKTSAVSALTFAMMCLTGLAVAQNAATNASGEGGTPVIVLPPAVKAGKDIGGSGAQSEAKPDSATDAEALPHAPGTKAAAAEKIELEEDVPPPEKPKRMEKPRTSGASWGSDYSEESQPQHEEGEPFTDEKSRPGRHLHDGFYLQMALGLGYLGATASEGSEELSFDGAALTGSLWIGGSVMPGFVLGGGTLSAIAFSPHVTYTNSSDPSLNENGSSDVSLHLQMLGLVSDIYPDPRSGLHFQAMLGDAVLSVTQNGQSTTNNDPSGLGLMAGVGYDFWVSNEWSIGVLARVAYAATKFDDAGASISLPTTAPGLLATFTYN